MRVMPVAFFIVAYVAIVSFSMGGFGRDDGSPKITVATLNDVLASIPTHPGDHWVGSLRKFDKGILTGATGGLISDSSPEELVEFYRAELQKLGWVIKELRLVGGRPALSMCRNRINFGFEVSPATGKQTFYYLGLTWSNERASHSYCSA